MNFHFYGTQKKLILFFVYHHFFIFSFYITYCQHVNLLRSGTGNKETFNPSFTHLSDIYCLNLGIGISVLTPTSESACEYNYSHLHSISHL